MGHTARKNSQGFQLLGQAELTQGLPLRSNVENGPFQKSRFTAGVGNILDESPDPSDLPILVDNPVFLVGNPISPVAKTRDAVPHRALVIGMDDLFPARLPGQEFTLLIARNCLDRPPDENERKIQATAKDHSLLRDGRGAVECFVTFQGCPRDWLSSSPSQTTPASNLWSSIRCTLLPSFRSGRNKRGPAPAKSRAPPGALREAHQMLKEGTLPTVG